MKLKTYFSMKWKSWIEENTNNGVERTVIFNTLLSEGFSFNAIKKELGTEPEIKQELSLEWRFWINENIAAGQDKNGLFRILLLHGYSFDCITEAMNYIPDLSIDELLSSVDHSTIDKSSNQKNLFGQQFKPDRYPKNLTSRLRTIASEKLEIYGVEDFLTQYECEEIIEIIKSNLKPSKLSSQESDQFFRTSKTCEFDGLKNKIIRSLDKRICELIGIPNNFSEPMQGQFYDVNEEFKPHTDYFEKDELLIHGNKMGQRTYTVMIYLNNVEKGGETNFLKLGQVIKPKIGKAIVWNNLNNDGSPNIYSIHHAQPIKRGFKAIITKWFRQNSKNNI